MSPSLNALLAMLYRQLKRWWNARSRVIMTVLNPLIWMVFLGLGRDLQHQERT
jgi:ABC-2 type transport system permease protein